MKRESYEQADMKSLPEFQRAQAMKRWQHSLVTRPKMQYLMISFCDELDRLLLEDKQRQRQESLFKSKPIPTHDQKVPTLEKFCSDLERRTNPKIRKEKQFIADSIRHAKERYIKVQKYKMQQANVSPTGRKPKSKSPKRPERLQQE